MVKKKKACSILLNISFFYDDDKWELALIFVPDFHAFATFTAPLEVTAPRPPGDPLPTLSEVMAEHKRYVDNFTKLPIDDYSGMTLNVGTSLSAPPVQCTFNIPATVLNGGRLALEAPPVVVV